MIKHLIIIISPLFFCSCSSTQVMDSFDDGRPKVIRSSQPGKSTLKELKEQGFKTVINLRKRDYYSDHIKSLDMRYEQIIIRNIQPTDEQIDRFLTILNDENNYPLLIHCQQGTHRTGVMSAIYRIEYQDWSNEAALDEMSTFLYALTIKPIKHSYTLGTSYVQN